MLEINKKIAHRVIFEILESEGVKNFDIMAEFIKNVKAMGCTIAIDDFGSGYSNFDYIIKLNVDYIKIDSSIIKNLDTDGNSMIIAKMIVNAAKELGILTIAEFVHSKSVYEKCLELGIDYSQGYFFSEPWEFIQ
jgi:c-di-GMP phosphodiesterase